KPQESAPAEPATDYQEPYSPPTAELSDHTPSVKTEEKPPVGYDLVFSYNQIRYCLSEDIRLGAIKNALDHYSENEVDRFNAEIADYNNRCSHFRYHSGALESVRAEVNPLHDALVAEGLERLYFWRVTNNDHSKKSKHKSANEYLSDLPDAEFSNYIATEGEESDSDGVSK
ncbi:conserved hypothetical protein, partial [Ricinus communis]